MSDSETEEAAVEKTDAPVTNEVSLVPEKNKGYVPFGAFEDCMAIIKSRQFYTVYITGLSGNGKTLMVEQACARAKRECLRLNVTGETDEDDLLGGFRLANDNGTTKTVFQMGPVPLAMQRGAILLLDEVDMGTPKLMALQPILEGKPVYLKKINKIVHPAPGFNVFATANTKGRGDLDGKFVGANMQNEAFLERFTITFEQEYPAASIENKILMKVMEEAGQPDKADLEFIENLVKWSEAIRATYMDGGCNDVMSTRRLVGLVRSYCIFNRDRMKALDLVINRFDQETKVSWKDLYTKVDADSSKVTQSGTVTVSGKKSGAKSPVPW
jgi:hypothetical protein